MASARDMAARLPTLYRPEAGDVSLLARLLDSIGGVLDAIQDEAGALLLSHWLDYADSAFYSPWAARLRDLAEQPPLDQLKPEDRAVAAIFPFVDDLARMGALLPAYHFREPAHLPEVVEAYRSRLRATVELYKNGLGTLGALRRMVEIQLPRAMDLPAAQRGQPFQVEERAPHATTLFPAPTPGAPDGILGPLMGWTVPNPGSRAVPPTVIIRAEAEAVRPMIEYSATRVGLAWSGTLAPGDALRLRPRFASWTTGADGLLLAASESDPTAPGPWSAVPSAPAAISALFQTPDLVLWAAAGSELWRFDGTNWARALDALPALRCLAGDGATLLAGSDGGLLRIPLYPQEGDPFVATPVAALAGLAVNALLRRDDGSFWVATSTGAAVLAGDTLTLTLLQGTEVFALHADGPGVTFFGCEAGLFLHQAAGDRWHSFAGTVRSEQSGDWEPFTGAVPADAGVALPPVLAIARDGDGALWLGTGRGLARYRARSVRGLTYETILEAFPDLGDGPVTALRLDARGLLWIASSRGLLRFDGRELWQHRPASGWAQLGSAEFLYPPAAEPVPRGAWRFDRASAAWRQFDTRRFEFDAANAAHLRTSAEPAVSAFTWSDALSAETGTWDGATFAVAAAVPPSELQVRVKPTNLRILAGGIPSLPRLPAGSSAWRYLARELGDGSDLPNPPAWTSEARLLPTPEAAEAIPGRFEDLLPLPDSRYDAAAFPYPPVVRIWFAFQPEGALSVTVRIRRRAPGDVIDPAILDRVWRGIQQVRPAGLRVRLAVEEEIVRDGSAGG